MKLINIIYITLNYYSADLTLNSLSVDNQIISTISNEIPSLEYQETPSFNNLVNNSNNSSVDFNENALYINPNNTNVTVPSLEYQETPSSNDNIINNNNLVNNSDNSSVDFNENSLYINANNTNITLPSLEYQETPRIFNFIINSNPLSSNNNSEDLNIANRNPIGSIHINSQEQNINFDFSSLYSSNIPTSLNTNDNSISFNTDENETVSNIYNNNSNSLAVKINDEIYYQKMEYNKNLSDIKYGFIMILNFLNIVLCFFLIFNNKKNFFFK